MKTAIACALASGVIAASLFLWPEPQARTVEVVKEVPVVKETTKIVEKPVEKIVYVDKPVIQERVVYVDKPVIKEVVKVVEKPARLESSCPELALRGEAVAQSGKSQAECNCHFRHSTKIYCPVHNRWH